MEKSDIIDINKGGNIVSMVPYTQIHTQRKRQEWLEWRLTPSFIFILPTFLRYHIHLPCHSDMYIKMADYWRKEINITDIWYAWLRPYCWISSHDHPDRSVDWDSQVPQKWHPLVLLIFLSTQDHTVAVIMHDESSAVFSWKGESLEEYWYWILNALI